MVPLFMKTKSRRGLAAAMVEKLIDHNVWFQSCAMGSKIKKQIDPKIINYVHKKSV